ncbi:acyl-CoA dehydrogenase family protein [Streptomyces griseoviridis]|uniref:Alkylation response protein AidB-like acyl-CoA dehydrogenase n=1 Tax=Streptomyces griseoviridis TaxID=45398 RepID=A0ABT9L8J2_STRGD|nr:acyl-CoA dehydrogenase family protein [Streptomyces griseoviridis]MDP9679610.1 alkylation response protein AidB-like acyl-CoA dehydrogenase [Streptomyces griseoviridis]GGS99926.1 monooxygenase [Streptomyces griseoviridis]
MTTTAPLPPRTGTPDRAHWLRVAREVADDLATDALTRDQAGKPPFDEVARLREAGLLTLLVPVPHGGGGADWATAHAVVRDIAAADGAIGQLLGGHYVLSWTARFFAGPALADQVARRSAAGQWCWGGGFAAHEPPLRLTPRAAGGYLLNGRQGSVGGARVADRLAVRAARSDTGEPLAVLVDPAHPGVTSGDDGDAFGQRLSGGGSVEFDAVPVAEDAVLGSLSADEGALPPFAGLAAATARLVSAQLCLGIAEGVLAEAREYTMTREYSRAAEYARAGEGAWTGALTAHHAPAGVPAWQDGLARDPHVLVTYGELTVEARAASALADQAVAALDDGLARGEDLTDDECAEVSVLAAAAEAAAARAVHDITTRTLDVIGPGAASSRHGFDRFWRNARTHTLHHPVAHGLREVGDYFLSGSHPPFALPA